MKKADGAHALNFISRSEGFGTPFFALLIPAALLCAAVLLKLPKPIEIILLVVAWLLAGIPAVVFAVKRLREKEYLNDWLIIIAASLASFFAGCGVWGVCLLILLRIAKAASNTLENRAVKKIPVTAEKMCEFATVQDGELWQNRGAELVKTGELIKIASGECVPLDCVIESGSAYFDFSALNGDNVPVEMSAGDTLPSGCVNRGEPLTARVCATVQDSTAQTLRRAVVKSRDSRSLLQRRLEKVFLYLRPALLAIALLTAVLPQFSGDSGAAWVCKALCAAALACCGLPEAAISGIYGCVIVAAAKKGYLASDAQVMEKTGSVSVLALDKTGLLTDGKYTVTGILPADGISQTELMRTAALAESGSNHPAARAISQSYASPVANVKREERAGLGVIAHTDEGEILLGSYRLMLQNNVECPQQRDTTAVYVALNNKYIGSILLSDKPRPGCAAAIARLKNLGVGRVIMLTGDSGQSAAHASDLLGIEEFMGGLMPADKATEIKRLVSERGENEAVAFICSGEGELGAMAAADIAVCSGFYSVQAADAMLLYTDLESVCDAVELARKTRKKMNIITAAAVVVKVICLAAALAVPAAFPALALCIPDLLAGICLLAAARRMPKTGKR